MKRPVPHAYCLRYFAGGQTLAPNLIQVNCGEKLEPSSFPLFDRACPLLSSCRTACSLQPSGLQLFHPKATAAPIERSAVISKETPTAITVLLPYHRFIFLRLLIHRILSSLLSRCEVEAQLAQVFQTATGELGYPAWRGWHMQDRDAT